MASKYTDLISKLAARNAADQKKFADSQNSSFIWTPKKKSGNNKWDQWSQKDSFSATNSFYEGLDPASLNQVKAANNSYDKFFQENQALNSLLDQYMPWMSQDINNSNQLNLDVFKDIERQFNLQRENVLRQYWPEWDMSKRIKDFYWSAYWNIDNAYWDAMWALDKASQENTAIYQGNVQNLDTAADVSWASSAQLAASKAKADRELSANQLANAQAQWDLWLKRLESEFALKQQEMQDYNNLYQQLNSYLESYIQNFWNTRDKYLINNFNNLLNIKSQLQQYLKWLELQNKALATDIASWQAASWQAVTAVNPTINNSVYKQTRPQTSTYETWVTIPYNQNINSGVSNWYVYPWTKPNIPLNKNVIPFNPLEIKNPYSSPFTKWLRRYGL